MSNHKFDLNNLVRVNNKIHKVAAIAVTGIVALTQWDRSMIPSNPHNTPKVIVLDRSWFDLLGFSKTNEKDEYFITVPGEQNGFLLFKWVNDTQFQVTYRLKDLGVFNNLLFVHQLQNFVFQLTRERVDLGKDVFEQLVNGEVKK